MRKERGFLLFASGINRTTTRPALVPYNHILLEPCAHRVSRGFDHYQSITQPRIIHQRLKKSIAHYQSFSCATSLEFPHLPSWDYLAWGDNLTGDKYYRASHVFPSNGARHHDCVKMMIHLFTNWWPVEWSSWWISRKRSSQQAIHHHHHQRLPTCLIGRQLSTSQKKQVEILLDKSSRAVRSSVLGGGLGKDRQARPGYWKKLACLCLCSRSCPCSLSLKRSNSME